MIPSYCNYFDAINFCQCGKDHRMLYAIIKNYQYYDEIIVLPVHTYGMCMVLHPTLL